MKIFERILFKNVFTITLFILILLNAVFWGSRKEGFAGDELYSHQFVSVVDYPSINADRGDKETYLNRWHDSSYYVDYLTISDDEAFDIGGTYQNIIQDVHPPLYYILLEIFNSLFFRNIFSKWGGIGLNLCFFILTLFVLKRFSEKFFKSLWWALVACAFYGFSVGAVSTVIFIRMYMMLTFASILLCYINYSIWEEINTGEVSIKSKFRNYGILLFSVIFGMLTQYYFLIFAFFTCAVFWICLLINKHWRSAIEYAVMALLGLVCSYLVWPEIVHDISSGHRASQTFDNLRDISSLKGSVDSFDRIISEELFGNHFTIWVGCVGILLLIFTVLQFIQITFYDNRQNEWVISIQSKKLEITIAVTADIIFFIAMLISTAMYLLLIAWIAPYKTDRYIFNIYPIVGLLFIYVVKRITGLFSKSSIMRGLTMIFMLLVIILGYKEAGVRYLYVDAEAKLNTIQQYSEFPAITIVQNNRRFLSCVNSFYYRYSNYIYLLTSNDIEELPDVLTDKQADGYIFYIDKKIEDAEAELEKIIDLTCMDANYEFLFETSESSVYLIHK